MQSICVVADYLLAYARLFQPGNSQLHATLGSLLAAIDRYESSIKAFESAIAVAETEEDHETICL